MNQLRENWHALDAQIVFLLSPLSYHHLTLNADHLKRWISLKLHFKPTSIGYAQLAQSEAAFTRLDPFGSVDVLPVDLARRQLETLSSQLSEALVRGEPEGVLVRRYYLPLFAAAASVGDYERANSFRQHVKPEHLRVQEKPQWERLTEVFDRMSSGKFDVFLSYNHRDEWRCARSLRY